ncbi:hypothetical protein FQN60_011336, partial [Etheostoma spectabile]
MSAPTAPPVFCYEGQSRSEVSLDKKNTAQEPNTMRGLSFSLKDCVLPGARACPSPDQDPSRPSAGASLTKKDRSRVSAEDILIRDDPRAAVLERVQVKSAQASSLRAPGEETLNAVERNNLMRLSQSIPFTPVPPRDLKRNDYTPDKVTFPQEDPSNPGGGVKDSRQSMRELARVVRQVPGVNVTGKTGRQGSFEVSVNDKLVYSKLKTGSFPNPDEVISYGLCQCPAVSGILSQFLPLSRVQPRLHVLLLHQLSGQHPSKGEKGNNPSPVQVSITHQLLHHLPEAGAGVRPTVLQE